MKIYKPEKIITIKYKIKHEIQLSKSERVFRLRHIELFDTPTTRKHKLFVGGDTSLHIERTNKHKNLSQLEQQ